METNSPTFFLRNCFINSVEASYLEDQAEDNTEVQIFFKEDSKDYYEERLITNRIEVNMVSDNIQVKIESIAEIEVEDNSMEYEKFVKQNFEQLIQPGLGKASMIITDILEKMTNFPQIIDLYSGLTNSDDQENDDD